MRRTLALLATAVLCLPCHAQVTARQGPPDAAPERTFKSPMILEVPFVPETWPKGPVRTTLVVQQGQLLELDAYECELFIIEKVTFSHPKQRKGAVRYWVELQTYTRTGIDKLATVTLEILPDPSGPSEAALVFRDVDAEERKRRWVGGELAVPEAVLGTTPPPTLRITVSVRDNG